MEEKRIIDNDSKSSIFGKVFVLWISGSYKYLRLSEKAIPNNSTFHPDIQ